MIVAQRSLYVRSDAKSRPVEVLITFGAPYPDKSAWRCDFSIGWPEGSSGSYGMGYDSAQALLSALQLVAVQLYASRYHHSGSLYFDESAAGYGFPLPASGRDLAVGLDKKL